MDFKAIVLKNTVDADTGNVIVAGSVAEIDAIVDLITTVTGQAWVAGKFSADPIFLEVAMLTGPAAVGNTVTRDSACFRP